jgi:hypothetical protein
LETKKGQETILCFKSEQDLLYLTLARGDLHFAFTKYGDFLVLFVQFIRVGEMLG